MMLDTLVFRGSAATFRTMKGTYAGGPLSLYPLVGPYPSKSSVYKYTNYIRQGDHHVGHWPTFLVLH